MEPIIVILIIIKNILKAEIWKAQSIWNCSLSWFQITQVRLSLNYLQRLQHHLNTLCPEICISWRKRQEDLAEKNQYKSNSSPVHHGIASYWWKLEDTLSLSFCSLLSKNNTLRDFPQSFCILSQTICYTSECAEPAEAYYQPSHEVLFAD